MKRGFQSSAPRCAVAEQFEYIQSMPFSSTRRIRLWVSSSTVSLNASLGLWPFVRSTSYCASMMPASAPMSTPRSPVRSLYDLVLEGGREQVAGADADAERQAALLGAAGGVLVDGEAGVDAGAGEEVAAHVQARALGRDHDHVHVLRRDDAGLVL